MVTKGIITSIDFNGNTCQVRIPLFETAGNDPITGTAIVSNTPGSYNGYKVGDVVLVAFEDGKMQNPVIVGKLYLGAAKEKQDPRGTINVETTTASKSASLPADAVLTANVDSNVPNTNTPFGSLASIANNLNSLNTDVNQLDRFTRNQFNSVITDVNDQGEQLRSEIKQTAENIEANVVHTHKDGSQKGLGWDLDEKEWKINAKDTVVNGVVKDINIVTIDRSGMTLSGDLKLNGYPKNITVLYVRIDPNTELPQLYEFKPVDFPETSPENPIDNAWYYGKYIQITEAETGKEKYVLILKENFEYYNKLEQLKPGETIAYSRDINHSWSTTVPERVDGQYIWQWTHTEIYSFDEVNNIWNEKDDDKIACITGAKGDTGTAAVSTWLAVSNPVHTGKNQQTPITIKALKQIGDTASEELAAWFLVDGATPTFNNPTSTITLSKENLAEANVTIRASYTKDDFDNKKYFEEETITFSPLNTPILDLSNDGDFLPYNSSGTKIGDNSVSSTAAVYFNGVKVENPGEFIWKVYKVEGENKTELTTSTDTDQWSINGDTISVSKISTTNWEAVCSIAYTWNGITTNLSKTFSITKQIQGEDAVDYYLNISSLIHTGETQTSNISIEAKKRIGVSGLEEPDTAAYLYWRYANQSTWTTGSDGKITIETPFKNQDIELIAARKSLGTNISSSNENVYEVETITYSPLNTPVIDLSNDTDDLSYDASGANKIDNDESVTSTARLYLNGKEITSNLAYAWTIPNGVTATGYNTNTITVSGLSSQSAAITCTITIGASGIDGKFANLKYSKVFTVTKKLKGSPGTPGTPGDTGVGISECKTYYSLSNIPTGPITVDNNGNENIASTPAVNTWSTSPQAFDKDKYQGYEYWTVERRVYTNGNVVWGAPVKASMLSADFINSLGITAKKITVLQDNSAEGSAENPILFQADGINGTGKVKIADFDVNYESLKSFSKTNGYELNIRSASEIEKNEEITIDDTYMTWEDILVPSSTAQQTQQIRPQLNWDTMEKWPKNGRYDPKDGVDIKDASITDNYTLLHLDTPAWDTTSDIKNDIWLTPQGYISFLKISIEQDILDFNAWIGIISSSSKNELNNSDYLSSQDTIRLFSSTTNFETWEALKTELDKFKSGSASQLSELGYCRPAIGDETSKMPMPEALTDNLVKFSWGNLSAKTYLYCVVENNYQRDFIVSNSSESGQDKVIEYEDAYGNIHTIIVPAGADATLVPGYLQAFLILDKTFTKYGVAISAGYNGEDFILTGDGKLITSNILVTGGSITADSGNIGPLEISAGEINTAGLMINKSSTHIKNGASLKILGVSGNTTKPIAKLSKNGFIISAQGMQAENNKYFSYKIGEVNGANDEKNTPGLLWKQRNVGLEYITVYVRAKLDSTNKKIIFTLYSDSARTKQYDTKQLPSNKTLDVMVYLKYIKKIIRKRKISRDITIEVDGSAVKTNFITLPTQLITTVSPIQFKFKNGDASIQEVSFANISVFDKIYGISSTRGGAPQAESEPLEFTISTPASINALDPNLYITSSILPASTFKKDGSVTKETKNEYDLGSSTYPWNNVYSKYFYGVSDRREKTDITPLSEQNNLDEFYNKLKPVSFSFKSSNDTLHFGLIAQDVDEASAGLPTDKPLAIVNKSDPNCLSIDYQELIAVNILKIQQLSKKIDSLEAEIKCLKGEDK